MSAFSPLNLVEDASKKDLEEEHTRELEVENAYVTFQAAMALHSAGDLAQAYLKYRDLGNSPVIVNHYYEEVAFVKGIQNGGSNTQSDELGFLPQNVKSIRYLYFRNRGFLFFRILQQGPELVAKVLELDTDESTQNMSVDDFTKDLFYTMVDGFVSCLVYQEPDDALLRLLHDIFAYLDIKKLVRMTLEYALAFETETDDITGLLPLNGWARPLWKRFVAESLAGSGPSPELNEKLRFLQLIKDDFHQATLKKFKLNTLTVTVQASPSWNSVISAINAAMKDRQDRERVSDFARLPCKHYDPYLLTEESVDKLKFEFLSGEEPVTEPEVEQPPVPEPEEPRDSPSVEIAEITPDAGEKIMRLSKRLNPGDSGPIATDNIVLVRSYFVETEALFSFLTEQLASVYTENPPVLRDAVGFIVTTNLHKIDPVYIGDFLRVLNEWRSKEFDPLLQQQETQVASSGDHRRLIEVLTSFGNQYTDPDIIVEHIEDVEDHEYVKNYVCTKFATGLHAVQTKMDILRHLLDSIVNKSWPITLYEAVSDWVMQLEPEILSAFEVTHGLEKSEELHFALGIYEILINAYITTKDQIEALLDSGSNVNTKSSKGTFNILTIELLRINDRVEKWTSLFERVVFSNQTTVSQMATSDVSSVVRYYWSANYFVAAKSLSWREKKYVVVHLNTLSTLLEHAQTTDFYLPLPNYSRIGEFTLESLHRRLSTASILSIFTKILDHSGSASSSNNDTILLLESILINDDRASEPLMENSNSEEGSLVNSVIKGHASLDKKSLSSVKEFFNECPVDLKLSLWRILFSYYEKGSFDSYQKGFEHNLEFIASFLDSAAYRDHKGDRSVLLLTLLESYSGYLKIFLSKLAENRWQLPETPTNSRTMTNLCRLFELCYCFSLHEEAALITSRKVSLEIKSESSFNFFKNFCVDSITLIMIYFVNHMLGQPEQDDKVGNIIVVVHNQIGLRRLCDASKGIFLKFSQDALLSLTNPPERELGQLMSCRFHYKIKLNGQFPVDHYTEKSADLNKTSAEELVTFILPLCFKRNPLTHTPRNDLKQVVEDLYEIIGDPDTEHDKAVSENIVTVESFLEHTVISPRFTKEAFYGIQSLDFLPPDKGNKVADYGLYYFEAVLMFNFYKIRKKSAQSRIVELEKIISLLTVDLVYGSQRVESWILLAQAYGYIVEDDLIWTSDKINIIDRKVATANLQRKSLLCYIMAVSHMTKQGLSNTEESKAVIGVLMNTFVRELYSAIGSPMDMIAFKVSSGPKFVRKKGQNVLLMLSDKPSLSTHFCLVLMNRCLRIATKMNPTEWSSFFYLAKVQAKLKLDHQIILDNLLKASELARIQSINNDRLMEPTYKFFCLLYKFVKSDKMTVEEGVKYMNLEPTLKVTQAFESSDKKWFYGKIIECFDRIKALDKKSWYHKPAYRKAVIKFEDFDDAKGAEASISEYFTLRSNNKTFLSMWKPEYERPGKHFVYMYQYTQFYIKILARQRDLSSLGYMFPKLRRANSTMVSLYFAWDQMCSSFCKIVRDITRIEDGYVERFLGSYIQSRFMAQAKIVTEAVKWDGASENVHKYMVLLHILAEMRKLNNGFGPTSLIDDTFAGLFVKIYSLYVTKELEAAPEIITDSPSGKIKKLAKKDLFPFAVEICTKSKRNVEAFTKENPDLLNSYVSAHDEEEANLVIRRELAKAVAQWKVQQRQGMGKMVEVLLGQNIRLTAQQMTTPQPQQNAVFGMVPNFYLGQNGQQMFQAQTPQNQQSAVQSTLQRFYPDANFGEIYRHPVNWAQISSVLSSRNQHTPADQRLAVHEIQNGEPHVPSELVAPTPQINVKPPTPTPASNAPAPIHIVKTPISVNDSPDSSMEIYHDVPSYHPTIAGVNLSLLQEDLRKEIAESQRGNQAEYIGPRGKAKVEAPIVVQDEVLGQEGGTKVPEPKDSTSKDSQPKISELPKDPEQKETEQKETPVIEQKEPEAKKPDTSEAQAETLSTVTETTKVSEDPKETEPTTESASQVIEISSPAVSGSSQPVPAINGKRTRSSSRAAALRSRSGTQNTPLVVESDDAEVVEVEEPEAKRKK